MTRRAAQQKRSIRHLNTAQVSRQNFSYCRCSLPTRCCCYRHSTGRRNGEVVRCFPPDGIAVDTTEPSRLYLASYHGVWLTNPDGTATRVSDNRNDYMGFTPNRARPGSFFASSHPERGGNPGVLSSSDGARTWRQVSAGVNGLLTSIPWMSCIASPEMFPRCGRCLIRNAPLKRPEC